VCLSIKAFINLAHLVDDLEENLISLFMSGLREDLRGKVKMDMPLTMVATYRSACAREMIALIDKRLSRFQSYKNSSSPVMHTPPAAQRLTSTTTSKEGVLRLKSPLEG